MASSFERVKILLSLISIILSLSESHARQCPPGSYNESSICRPCGSCFDGWMRSISNSRKMTVNLIEKSNRAHRKLLRTQNGTAGHRFIMGHSPEPDIVEDLDSKLNSISNVMLDYKFCGDGLALITAELGTYENSSLTTDRMLVEQILTQRHTNTKLKMQHLQLELLSDIVSLDILSHDFNMAEHIISGQSTMISLILQDLGTIMRGIECVD